MASFKESVLSSPTTEYLPIGEPPIPNRQKLKPGQYSLDTYFNISCENHKDKKAVLRLSGDIILEYKDDVGLCQW